MKTGLTLLLLISSLILASVFHMKKVHQAETDLDHLSASLESMKPYIGPTSNIFIENRTNIFHLPFMLRIILAPAYTTINGSWDTTLILSEKDSVVIPTPDSKILWQHTDNRYQYTLTSKQ